MSCAPARLTSKLVRLEGASSGWRHGVRSAALTAVRRRRICEPDRPGLDYWTNALDKGLPTLPQGLFGFSDSADNKATVAELIGHSLTYTEWLG